MCGTAPLIPILECEGHKAYLNDILPIHFFVNQAKTLRMFNCYRDLGRNWFSECLFTRLGRLNGKQLVISEKWIDDDVLDVLVNAWNKTENDNKPTKTLMRTFILLCVRSFSCITKSKNSTWVKIGGVSSNKSLSVVIADSLNKFENYFTHNYGDSENCEGKCVFLNSDVLKLKLPEKVDLILTSPPYCNRFDIATSYGPEVYFLSKVGFITPRSEIIGTNDVKNYESFETDLSFLMRESKTANKFLSTIMKSENRDEQTYYAKYYTRYFTLVIKAFEKSLSNLLPEGKMYFVTQDNIHRGQLIEIDTILRELLVSIGWKCRRVDSWERHHLGLQNISREKALIKPKQFEKLTMVCK